MWALFFMMRTSCGVESAHWPFWMGLMKRFLNSLTEPSRFSLMKFTMQWSVGGRSHTSSGYAQVRVKPSPAEHLSDEAASHSMRLFCRGVPVSTTLLRVLMEFMAFDTADASFFKMWPSSQITKSGPDVSRMEQVKLFNSSKVIIGLLLFDFLI